MLDCELFLLLQDLGLLQQEGLLGLLELLIKLCGNDALLLLDLSRLFLHFHIVLFLDLVNLAPNLFRE